MINVVVILLIAIGLASVAAYGAIAVFDASKFLVDSQRSRARLQAAATLVEGALLDAEGNGIIRAPQGQLSGGFTVLPAFLNALDRNVKNVRFHYCPFAPHDDDTTGATGTVTYPSGSPASYAVVLQSSILTDGRNYVTASPAPPADYPEAIAILTAAMGDATAPPRCDDVVAGADGLPRVPGGIAEVILAPNPRTTIQTGVETSALGAARTYYASPSGTGSGRTAASPGSFDSAIALWRAQTPRALRLVLAAGTYSVTTGAAQFTSSAEDNRRAQTLTIEGAGAGSTTLNGSFTMEYPARLVLSGVTLGSGTALRAASGYEVTLRDATLPRLLIEGGRVLVRGSVTLSGASGQSSLAQNGGRLTVDGTLTSNISGSPAYGAVVTAGDVTVLTGGTFAAQAASGQVALRLAAGARLKSEAATLSFSAASGAPLSGVRVETGARLEAEAGTLSVANNPTHGIRVIGGLAAFDAATISFPNDATNGVTLEGGGILAMSGGTTLGGTTAATAPTTGVNATLVGRVFGTTAQVNANSTGACCLGTGNADGNSFTGGTGATSCNHNNGGGAGKGEYFLMINRKQVSGWSCTGR